MPPPPSARAFAGALLLLAIVLSVGPAAEARDLRGGGKEEADDGGAADAGREGRKRARKAEKPFCLATVRDCPKSSPFSPLSSVMAA